MKERKWVKREEDEDRSKYIIETESLSSDLRFANVAIHRYYYDQTIECKMCKIGVRSI